jgi:hypothetical protein
MATTDNAGGNLDGFGDRDLGGMRGNGLDLIKVEGSIAEGK